MCVWKVGLSWHSVKVNRNSEECDLTFAKYRKKEKCRTRKSVFTFAFMSMGWPTDGWLGRILRRLSFLSFSFFPPIPQWNAECIHSMCNACVHFMAIYLVPWNIQDAWEFWKICDNRLLKHSFDSLEWLCMLDPLVCVQAWWIINGLNARSVATG